jgi:hypothetical protein
LINTLNNPVLSEKTLTGYVRQKEQGDLFGTQLLPERSVNSKAIYWLEQKNTRELAPEIREGSEETLTSVSYEEKSAIVKEIREGAMLTEQAIAEADLRDLVRDHLDHLVERNILKQESMIFTELIAKAGTVGGTAWDWSSTSTADPLNDIFKAITDAKKAGFVNFDTMIIDPDREYELLANKAIREVLLQSSPSTILTGSNVRALGNLKGLNIYVANAVIDTPTGTSQLFSGKTILMKRGADTGHTLVREALQVRRFPDLGKRSIRLQVFKTLHPVIYKPQNIAVYNHA